MIPILFSKTETNFTTNGLGRLSDCVSCKVTEERNGVYECEFEYPIDGAFYQEMHDNGGVIGVIHDDKHDIQPFDIYGFEAPINGVVTFYAHHISYRLNNIIVTAFDASSVSEVMVKLSTMSANTNPFTFWTDKLTSANFSLNHPESIRALLGGSEGSILDIYGGEYEFDKLTLKLHSDRGNDSGVTIRYGKNMTDISHEKDESETYNAIAPYWIGTDDQEQEVVVTLPETYIMATGHIETARPVAVDMSSEFNEEPTQAQLRARAQAFIDNNAPWVPHENIKVDFVQLWQTPEYENIASLLRVSLCDYVSIYYPELGVVQEKQKVIRVVYDVLLERFSEMEIGEAESTLSQTIVSAVAEETSKQIEDFGSTMKEAIENATEWITGGLGGYVIFKKNADGQPEEILIMDTADISTAVNVIRMNKNGIGFSTNGYAGPYTTAWTIDGNFSADFITSGTLSANLIKAGLLSDFVGKNYWNMLTGEFSIDSGDIKLSGDKSYAHIGTVTVKYLDSSVTPYVFRTRTRTGLETKSKDDINSIVIAANYNDSSGYLTQGTMIYAETTENSWGGYQHMRVYKGKYANTEYIFEEGTLYGWNWLVYDVTNNTFKAHLSVDIDGLCLKRHYGNSIANILRASETQLYWAGWNGNSTNASLSVTANGIQGGALTTSNGPYINVASNGFWIKSSSSLSLYSTSSSTLYFSDKIVSTTGSSSKRYKEQIKELEDDRLDPYRLLKLPVVQYKYKKDSVVQYEDMRGQTLPGFVAEDVAEIYPGAVVHDEDGRIWTWDERRIIPGMLKLIQDQQKTIGDLQARLEKLEKLVMGDR